MSEFVRIFSDIYLQSKTLTNTAQCACSWSKKFPPDSTLIIYFEAESRNRAYESGVAQSKVNRSEIKYLSICLDLERNLVMSWGMNLSARQTNHMNLVICLCHTPVYFPWTRNENFPTVTAQKRSHTLLDNTNRRVTENKIFHPLVSVHICYSYVSHP